MEFIKFVKHVERINGNQLKWLARRSYGSERCNQMRITGISSPRRVPIIFSIPPCIAATSLAYVSWIRERISLSAACIYLSTI